MRYPKDYIIPRQSVTLHLAIQAIPNKADACWLIGWITSPVTGEHFNAYNERGNTATHKRQGLWRISWHKNYRSASTKANWIANAPQDEIAEAQRIIFGEQKHDDLWDDWRYSDHKG
jgi:hypothetical protein